MPACERKSPSEEGLVISADKKTSILGPPASPPDGAGGPRVGRPRRVGVQAGWGAAVPGGR